MADNSAIQWTDATLNFARGCTRVSPGCDNCYMYASYPRWKAMGVRGYHRTPDVVDLTNATAIIGKLDHWKRPRRVFINSMSDTFHHDVPWAFPRLLLEKAVANPQHTLQVLTKRPGLAVAFWKWMRDEHGWTEWPANVWLGTSVESQKYAPRLDVLARVPAPVRFVSCEPLLGPLDLTRWLANDRPVDGGFEPNITWVICGGESGPAARPMVLGWAKEIARQCRHAGVALFMKQLGRWPTNREGEPHPLIHDRSHGGDLRDFPAELQVREFPRG